MNRLDAARDGRDWDRLKSPRRFVWLMAAALSLVLAGCLGSDVDTTYGERNGKSINGTGVLADMFRRAGYRVSTWRRLSPRLEQASTLVWFNDSDDPPTWEQRQFISEWLSHGVERTFVYVAHDFDASYQYWSQLQGEASPALWNEVTRRRAQAVMDRDQGQSKPPKLFAGWYVQDVVDARYVARELQGEWSEGIDSRATQIEARTHLVIPANGDEKLPDNSLTARLLASSGVPGPEDSNTPDQEASLELLRHLEGQLEREPLLTTERGHHLVVRIRQGEEATFQMWDGGQILVVANGSFLLNLPLVNPEHRKLAGKLIDECGYPDRVVFLEGSLPVIHEESDDDAGGLSLFRVWPLNLFLIHGVALGFLYCLARFPIFGRARRLDSGPVTDFYKHIAAVGDWLEKTGNWKYAKQLIENYHTVRSKEIR